MVKARRATSYDVAKLAGVSRAAVSVVLNGARSNIQVSAETRQRIVDAARQLDYLPHPSAQALRRQRSLTLGFVPRAFRRTPYDHPVPYLLGIHIARAAMRHGYHVIEASTETDVRWAEGELFRFLAGRRVDGVIFDWPGQASELQAFLDHDIPVVQVIRPLPGVATPAVMVDAAPGISAALEHLIALGHRQLAFVGHSSSHPVDRARLEAFQTTLARHGLAPEDGWIQLVDDYTVRHGYVATRALLQCPRLPTALFAMGDNLALGALQALHEAHLHVPEDLSLVSYDDVFAAYLPPPLTSVVQPLEEVAEQAVTALLARIAAPEIVAPEPATIVLPSQLTVRGSTAPPRAAG
jgi:DNA-binding LacI/PurR family transcriptional regulator